MGFAEYFRVFAHTAVRGVNLIASLTDSTPFGLISGSGAPSGGYDLPSTRGIYFREDGGAGTLIYYTIDSGTNWTALAASTAITDTHTWFTTDTVDAACDSVAAAIGGTSDVVRSYTDDTVVTDDQTLVASIDALDQAFSAVVDADTDGELQIPILLGTADAGTWTAAVAAGLETLTRTASADAQSIWIPIPVPNRSTALKGIMPTGLLVNYTVATADLDDVRFEIWKVTQGADGSARTAAVLFGDADADYDADHDTAAKRGDDTAAPELHLATLADAGTPAYLATGEALLLRVYVDGDAGPAGIFVLTSAILTYTQQIVDIS